VTDLSSSARIFIVDVRALTPTMYKEIYGLNYRENGWLQRPLHRARIGTHPAVIAVLVEHGRVLAYVLRHTLFVDQIIVEQAWTRVAYRHRGYNRLCSRAMRQHVASLCAPRVRRTVST